MKLAWMFASIAWLLSPFGALAETAFSPDAICKAAIAAIMGRDPAIIVVYKQTGDVLFLDYTRDDDTQWAYRCQVFDDRVMWASEPGRWRDDPADERIGYEASADGSSLTIIQRFSDGSYLSDTFGHEQLE